MVAVAHTPVAAVRPTASPAPPRWRRLRRDWRVLLVCAVAVLIRLPFLDKRPGSDESGFLIVGGQWFHGTGSLYGAYWVDRPPLLITIFGLAHALGGLVALRVIGCVFVAAAIYAVARLVRVLADGAPYAARAELWAAITTAALLCCALLGTFEINGELLASTFVAIGLALTAAAVRSAGGLGPGQVSERAGGALWQAGLAGASAMVAVLIKQNFIDAFVFAAVVLVACAVGKRMPPGHALRVALAGLAGALVALGVSALWTVLHGTSLSGVFYAMYPFRIAAGLRTAEFDATAADTRGQALLISAFSSGLVPMLVLVIAVLAVVRPRSPLALGLLAQVVYAACSIASGGSYWLHYLIQLIVPTGALVGVVLARGVGWLRVPVAALVIATLAYFPFTASITGGREGDLTGAALRRAGRPGDTLTQIYGHAEVNYAAGMASPYEYLWSLPIRTLDPRLTELQEVLAGPHAPTWFVANHVFHTWGVDPHGADEVIRLIHRRYHKVAVLCGHTVYLRDGVRRPTPQVRGHCDPPSITERIAANAP